MKFLVYLTLITSFVWSMVAFPDYSILSSLRMDIYSSMLNTLIGIYKYTLPCVTWGLALIYSYDFLWRCVTRAHLI